MKKIGIPGWMVTSDVFGVKTPYIEYISKFGVPVILTPHMTDVQEIDLLFLPGGADVDPFRYGSIPSYRTGNPNLMLEFFDKTMLGKYIDANIPIVGCCRALQTVVAHFGGKLTQHLHDHTQSSYNEHACHLIEFSKDYKYLNKYIDATNSRHHQCADPRSIPDCLEIIGYAKEVIAKQAYVDPNVPEVIIHKSKNIFLFQGHLEDLPNQELGSYVIERYLKGESIEQNAK